MPAMTVVSIWGRRLALAVYRIGRPVLRPVAWRLRAFLTAELMLEMADLRAKQDLMLARMQSQSAPGGDAAARDPGMARVSERLLLTLALEQRWPHRTGRGER